MIYLNYSNLNEETQEKLLQASMLDVKRKFGTEIREYAEKHHTNFAMMFRQEAQRNLYNYKYVFNI